MQKKIMYAFFVFLCSAFIFCESTKNSADFGMEFIKNSDISFEIPVQLNTGAIWNYAKASAGMEVRLGTRLFFINDVEWGICTTYFYNNYLWKREEIELFNVNGLCEGVWAQFALTEYFDMLVDLSGGFCVSKLKAQSIDGIIIDDYFNCAVLGTRVVVTGKFFNAGPVLVKWNCGANLKFMFEQNSINETFGLIAGICVMAGER